MPAIGGGIDLTPRTRVGAIPGWLGAVDAIRSLKALAFNPPPLQASAHVTVGVPSLANLRGLTPDWHDGLSLASPPDATERTHVTRRKDPPMPYVRFSEHEQVFGFSFKIQPPPQAPEPSPPGS